MIAGWTIGAGWALFCSTLMVRLKGLRKNPIVRVTRKVVGSTALRFPFTSLRQRLIAGGA